MKKGFSFIEFLAILGIVFIGLFLIIPPLIRHGQNKVSETWTIKVPNTDLVYYNASIVYHESHWCEAIVNNKKVYIYGPYILEQP